MPRTLLARLLVGAAAAATAVPALAINCYTIIDRNDNVVYRGTIPPVDLSDQGKAERDALRARGQQLIAMDVDRCIGVEYFTGAAGSPTLTVDQIVGGIQMRGVSPVGTTAAASALAPTPSSPARAPAPAPRSSSMSGSGTRSSN